MQYYMYDVLTIILEKYCRKIVIIFPLLILAALLALWGAAKEEYNPKLFFFNFIKGQKFIELYTKLICEPIGFSIL